MSTKSNRIYSNNVNRGGTENSEGLASGRDPECEQAVLGLQSDTVRPEENNQICTTTRKRKNRKWSKKKVIYNVPVWDSSIRLAKPKKLLPVPFFNHLFN